MLEFFVPAAVVS